MEKKMEKIKRHYDFLGRELLWAGRHKLTGEIIRVVMDDIDNNLYYVYLGDTGYDCTAPGSLDTTLRLMQPPPFL